MSQPFAMASHRGKEVLSLVRGEDFAHPGERDAIDLAMAGLSKDPSRKILDVGCGRGGTAAYLQSQGWGQVTGIDLEPNVIQHAKTAYPEATFHTCDVTEIAERLDERFDTVTLFSVLYAIEDQATALSKLEDMTSERAELVVFDYIDLGGYRDAPLMDRTRPLLPNPPAFQKLRTLLHATGWRLKEIENVTPQYETWYADLVAGFDAKRGEIEALIGEEDFAYARGLYEGILTRVRGGILGGAIIRAES